MKYIHLQDGFVDSKEKTIESSQTGVTLDDYYSGKYVPLNDKQLAFLESNPNISPIEAFLMVTTPSQEEIFQQRKRDKIYQIYRYDQSEAVNVFFVNNTPMWLSRSARASLYTTLNAYKANNKELITLWTSGASPIPITLNLTVFESLLMSLEIYAKECYDKTSEHKANISKIETIEELVAYDHTSGYPEKLRVQI